MSASQIKAGGAVVEISAESSKLARGLAQAKAAVSAWAPSVKGVLENTLGNLSSKAIQGLTSGLMGLVGSAANAFPAMVKGAADTAGAIGDLSARTGISAKSISTLTYAAKLADTDLAGLQSAMKNIAKELDAGGESFAKYGIDVDKMRKLSPEDQFKVVAEAVSRVQDPTARAAAAMDMLGKAGQDMLPLMLGGVAGIEKLQRQAERLGLSLSNEAVAAGEQFGDSLDTLGAQAAAMGTKIGMELIPHLQPLIDKLIESSTGFLQWVDDNSAALDKFLAKTSAVTLEILDTWNMMASMMLNGSIPAAIDGVIALFEVNLYNGIANFIDQFQALWDTQFVQYIAKTTRNAFAEVQSWIAKNVNLGSGLSNTLLARQAEETRNTDTSAKSVSGIARNNAANAANAADEAKFAFANAILDAMRGGGDALGEGARDDLKAIIGDAKPDKAKEAKRIATQPAKDIQTNQEEINRAAVGTFNARAAGGLAGNTDTAAIRVATQQTAKNTAKLAVLGGAASVAFGP